MLAPRAVPVVLSTASKAGAVSFNVPNLTVVKPVYVLAAVRVNTPLPIFVSEPLPLRTPENAVDAPLLPTDSATAFGDVALS